MNENELHFLIESTEHLKCVPFENRTDTFKDIILSNEFCLYENCIHEYIQDYVDVSLDKTVMITYCDRCNLPFDVNFYFEYFKNRMCYLNKKDWKISVRSHVCPLINFQLKTNSIQFHISKNDSETVLVNAYLKDLLNSKVYNDIIIIKNMDERYFIT
jgi:hypothetical protein